MPTTDLSPHPQPDALPTPDRRIQWHRYRASPPPTSRVSAPRTAGTQCSFLMLGSAVSSSTPNDFHSNPHKIVWALLLTPVTFNSRIPATASQPLDTPTTPA